MSFCRPPPTPCTSIVIPIRMEEKNSRRVAIVWSFLLKWRFVRRGFRTHDLRTNVTRGGTSTVYQLNRGSSRKFTANNVLGSQRVGRGNVLLLLSTYVVRLLFEMDCKVQLKSALHALLLCKTLKKSPPHDKAYANDNASWFVAKEMDAQ